MKTITGVLQGLAPLLFNRMTEASIVNMETGVSGAAPATVEGRIDEAKLRAYVDGDGVYLPPWNFKRMLLDGASGSKLKLSKTTLLRVVYASVFVDGPCRFLGKAQPDFIHEFVGKIPPRRGAAAIIRRPAMETGWELSFKLSLIEPIPPDLLRKALDYAGMRVGLGSWRPEHGRFLVKEWNPEA